MERIIGAKADLPAQALRPYDNLNQGVRVQNAKLVKGTRLRWSELLYPKRTSWCIGDARTKTGASV